MCHVCAVFVCMWGDVSQRKLGNVDTKSHTPGSGTPCQKDLLDQPAFFSFLKEQLGALQVYASKTEYYHYI